MKDNNKLSWKDKINWKDVEFAAMFIMVTYTILLFISLLP